MDEMTRRKHNFGTPISATTYSLIDDKLYIRSGVFNRKSEYVCLARVSDVQLNRGIMDRMVGLGTIELVVDGENIQHFSIKNIKRSEDFFAAISEAVDESINRVY